MKKIITTALAACMMFSFAACSSNTQTSDASAQSSQTEQSVAVNAEPKDIESAIATKLGDGYLATVQVTEEDLYLTPLAELDMTKIASYICKQTESPAVDADKVVIVKLSDASYADEVVKACNDDFQQTVHYIHQYPFGVAKVEGGKIYKINDFVIYVIAGKSAGENDSDEAEAKLAAEEYAKIDEAIKSVLGSVSDNLAKYDSSSETPADGDSDKPILGG